MGRPLLCGFFAHDKTVGKTSRSFEHGQQKFEADAVEQYRRRDNVRIVGHDDGHPNEDFCEQSIKVTDFCGLNLTRNVINVCHRLPSQTAVKRLLIARYARREKMIQLSQPSTLSLNSRRHVVAIFATRGE